MEEIGVEFEMFWCINYMNIIVKNMWSYKKNRVLIIKKYYICFFFIKGLFNYNVLILIIDLDFNWLF